MARFGGSIKDSLRVNFLWFGPHITNLTCQEMLMCNFTIGFNPRVCRRCSSDDNGLVSVESSDKGGPTNGDGVLKGMLL